MSVILNLMNGKSRSFDGKDIPKDSLKAHFNALSLASYSMPDDYENELKYVSSRSVSEIQNEIQTLFSTDNRHDSNQDGFFIVENTAEENGYYLTSIQVDTLQKDKNGKVIGSNQIQKADHQMRVRLAFHPHNVKERANRENQDAKRFHADNVLSHLGASHIYGIPEVSVKTLLSTSENQERGEFEVFLDGDDYAGTIIDKKGHALEPVFKEKLEAIKADDNTELYAEAICMTRRVMFYGMHYVAEHNAYVGYECTIDNNQFADVELNTAKNYSDREMEFEAAGIFPADGRTLTAKEQKDILDASTHALDAYILESTKSFEASWGSKMERASVAAQTIREDLSCKKSGLTTKFFDVANDQIHPCLALERNPGELLQNHIGDLYKISLQIDSPVCKKNSAAWLKSARCREAFFQDELKRA